MVAMGKRRAQLQLEAGDAVAPATNPLKITEVVVVMILFSSMIYILLLINRASMMIYCWCTRKE
jgi:hypothetical protein